MSRPKFPQTSDVPETVPNQEADIQCSPEGDVADSRKEIAGTLAENAEKKDFCISRKLIGPDGKALSLLEHLKESSEKIILVTGEAGMGKSTELVNLERQCLKMEDKKVYSFEASVFLKKKEFAQELVGLINADCSADSLEPIIIIDTLDPYIYGGGENFFAEAIDQLVAKNCKVILALRPEGLSRLKHSFNFATTEVELQKLKKNEILELCDKYSSALEDVNFEYKKLISILNQIEENAPLFKLLQNPFHVRLLLDALSTGSVIVDELSHANEQKLLDIYYKTKVLSPNPEKLRDNPLYQIYELENKSNDFIQERKSFLENIAMDILREGRLDFDLNDLVADDQKSDSMFVGTCLLMLENLVSEGLLIKRDGNKYAFSHQVLWEYLCVETILNKKFEESFLIIMAIIYSHPFISYTSSLQLRVLERLGLRLFNDQLFTEEYRQAFLELLHTGSSQQRLLIVRIFAQLSSPGQKEVDFIWRWLRFGTEKKALESYRKEDSLWSSLREEKKSEPESHDPKMQSFFTKYRQMLKNEAEEKKRSEFNTLDMLRCFTEIGGKTSLFFLSEIFKSVSKFDVMEQVSEACSEKHQMSLQDAFGKKDHYFMILKLMGMHADWGMGFGASGNEKGDIYQNLFSHLSNVHLGNVDLAEITLRELIIFSAKHHSELGDEISNIIKGFLLENLFGQPLDINKPISDYLNTISLPFQIVSSLMHFFNKNNNKDLRDHFILFFEAIFKGNDDQYDLGLISRFIDIFFLSSFFCTTSKTLRTAELMNMLDSLHGEAREVFITVLIARLGRMTEIISGSKESQFYIINEQDEVDWAYWGLLAQYRDGYQALMASEEIEYNKSLMHLYDTKRVLLSWFSQEKKETSTEKLLEILEQYSLIFLPGLSSIPHGIDTLLNQNFQSNISSLGPYLKTMLQFSVAQGQSFQGYLNSRNRTEYHFLDAEKSQTYNIFWTKRACIELKLKFGLLYNQALSENGVTINLLRELEGLKKEEDRYLGYCQLIKKLLSDDKEFCVLLNEPIVLAPFGCIEIKEYNQLFKSLSRMFDALGLCKEKSDYLYLLKRYGKNIEPLLARLNCINDLLRFDETCLNSKEISEEKLKKLLKILEEQMRFFHQQKQHIIEFIVLNGDPKWSNDFLCKEITKIAKIDEDSQLYYLMDVTLALLNLNPNNTDEIFCYIYGQLQSEEFKKKWIGLVLSNLEKVSKCYFNQIDFLKRYLPTEYSVNFFESLFFDLSVSFKIKKLIFESGILFKKGNEMQILSNYLRNKDIPAEFRIHILRRLLEISDSSIIVLLKKIIKSFTSLEGLGRDERNFFSEVARAIKLIETQSLDKKSDSVVNEFSSVFWLAKKTLDFSRLSSPTSQIKLLHNAIPLFVSQERQEMIEEFKKLCENHNIDIGQLPTYERSAFASPFLQELYGVLPLEIKIDNLIRENHFHAEDDQKIFLLGMQWLAKHVEDKTGKKARLVDFCTGSALVPFTPLRQGYVSGMTGVDLYPQTAQHNLIEIRRVLSGAPANVQELFDPAHAEILHGDLLEVSADFLEKLKSYESIILSANPPWVPTPPELVGYLADENVLYYVEKCVKEEKLLSVKKDAPINVKAFIEYCGKNNITLKDLEKIQSRHFAVNGGANGMKFIQPLLELGKKIDNIQGISINLGSIGDMNRVLKLIHENGFNILHVKGLEVMAWGWEQIPVVYKHLTGMENGRYRIDEHGNMRYLIINVLLKPKELTSSDLPIIRPCEFSDIMDIYKSKKMHQFWQKAADDSRFDIYKLDRANQKRIIEDIFGS